MSGLGMVYHHLTVPQMNFQHIPPLALLIFFDPPFPLSSVQMLKWYCLFFEQLRGYNLIISGLEKQFSIWVQYTCTNHVLTDTLNI